MAILPPSVSGAFVRTGPFTVSPFQHVRSAGSTVAGPCEGLPAVVAGRSDLRHFPSFYPDFQEAVCSLCPGPGP